MYNELGDPRDLISDDVEDTNEYNALPRYTIDICEQGSLCGSSFAKVT